MVIKPSKNHHIWRIEEKGFCVWDIPHNEAVGEVKIKKSQYLCGFADFEKSKNYAILRQFVQEFVH